MVEHISGTIKTLPGKISEAFYVPCKKFSLYLFLSLRSTHLAKHSLSPCELITTHPMHLVEGTYEPALLKGDILRYQGLINQLRITDKLATDSFHSIVLGDEDFKDQGLQQGDLVYWKRYQLKTLSNLLVRKVPYQVPNHKWTSALVSDTHLRL